MLLGGYELIITGNTISIHHYQESWHSEEDKYQELLKKKIAKLLPIKTAGYIAKYICSIKYKGFYQGNKELIGWFKRKRN